MDLTNIITGHSLPLYSTWVYYRPDNVLVDCGEGCATHFKNSGFGIDKILLTHSHNDHIGGLSTLIWSRISGMGDYTKPLSIYYPKGDIAIENYARYLASMHGKTTFPLTWNPVDVGQKIPLKHGRWIDTFQTQHHRYMSLGYRVKESRTRLAPQYANARGEEIKKLKDAGITFQEKYAATLITFGGDGTALKVEDVSGSEILFHEATIIDSRDYKGGSHSTMEQAIRVAANIKPKVLVLYHISGRYPFREILKQVKYFSTLNKTDFSIWVLYEGNLREIK